jgi:iron complex outermembrane recepter protein
VPVANYSEQTSLSGGLDIPAGTPLTWLVPDLNAAAQLFDLYNPAVFRMGIEPALGNNNAIEEEDSSGFVQSDFTFDVLGKAVRGNVGVRYVKTDQSSTGYAFNTGGPLLLTVDRSYTDTLPSLNLVGEISEELLVRFSAAKVMARPGLNFLNPGAAVSISGNNKTVNAGNPRLDPFRANAYDVGVEWYFAPEAFIGAALFYKDVKSFVQTIRSQGSFSSNTQGLPDSVAIAACGPAVPVATCLSDWQFNVPANTPGGELKGFEIAYQQPFTFLPAPFNNFGTNLNFTYVDSQIQYLGANAQGQNVVVTEEDLTGLSKNSANATLYYDNGTFNARISAAYRDDYFTQVPGRNANDVEGTVSTLNLDFSSSFSLNDNIDFTFEALNLTDEFNDQYVDSTANRLSVYHHTGRQYFLGARFRY